MYMYISALYNFKDIQQGDNDHYDPTKHQRNTAPEETVSFLGKITVRVALWASGVGSVRNYQNEPGKYKHSQYPSCRSDEVDDNSKVLELNSEHDG